MIFGEGLKCLTHQKGPIISSELTMSTEATSACPWDQQLSDPDDAACTLKRFGHHSNSGGTN